MAAHPGLSNTNLDRFFPALIKPLGNVFLQSPKKGVQPILYAALGKELEGGEYIEPEGFKELRWKPTIVHSDDSTKDREIANEKLKVAEKTSNF